MIELFLIRHGKTYGNTKGRYIGRTDEPLCEEGRRELIGKCGPDVSCVYVSPMLRCIETAQILYPGLTLYQENLLRETDFGIFENKNYLELKEEPAYQAWVDSNGTLPIPEGEDVAAFKERCKTGFHNILKAVIGREKRVALVVHGGTIMSILEAFGEPRQGFYQWQVKNADGFRVEFDEEAYTNSGDIRLVNIERIWRTKEKE